MHTPTSIDDLLDTGLSYRDAHVAAAILPHLPGDEVLVMVRPDPPARHRFTDEEDVERFKKRVPTVGGADNLRRCDWSTTTGDDTDGDDVELGTDSGEVGQVYLQGTPHGSQVYHMSLYDVDLLHPKYGDPESYDFDDTDQSLLSDWGVGASILNRVGRSIKPYPYPRKPTFPVYTG